MPAYRLLEFAILDVPPGRFRHGYLTLGPHRVGEVSQESGRGPRFSFTSAELREAFAKAYNLSTAASWASVGLDLLDRAEQETRVRRAKASILQSSSTVLPETRRHLVALENTPNGLTWNVHDAPYSKAAAQKLRKERDVVLILNEDPHLKQLRAGRAS
jgi:hypothetical protein